MNASDTVPDGTRTSHGDPLGAASEGSPSVWGVCQPDPTGAFILNGRVPRVVVRQMRGVSDLRGLFRRLLAWVRPARITPTTPPLTFVDGEGRDVELRPYRADDFEALVAMYDGFDPTQRAQGTPPIGVEAVRSWLDDVLGGVNVVAANGSRIVGHVSFVPDGTGRHELAIFVHQEFQRAGVGTELMAAGLGYAERQGVGYVWLTVEVGKRDVQRFYTRAGFTVVNPMGAVHRMSRTL